MSDKNPSCVPLKDCPPKADYYKTAVYKTYKSEIRIIRNAKQGIRAVSGCCEIWGMIRWTLLFKQMYLQCVLKHFLSLLVHLSLNVCVYPVAVISP